MKNKDMSAANKNYEKQASYALAHRMMSTAIEARFPLQAITIAESILADRLWSTLNKGADRGNSHATLGEALSSWAPKNPNKTPNPNAALFDKEMEMLKPDIDQWWKDRNKVLHGIAKSFRGEAPEIPASEYENYAQYVAIVGSELVRRVSNWSTKQIRRAKRNEAKQTKKTLISKEIEK